MHYSIFSLMIRPPTSSTLFPYTTLFRSGVRPVPKTDRRRDFYRLDFLRARRRRHLSDSPRQRRQAASLPGSRLSVDANLVDRKSTRLNSSHPSISYAVFCLKKKKTKSHY